jgi:hypothetical protein
LYVYVLFPLHATSARASLNHTLCLTDPSPPILYRLMLKFNRYRVPGSLTDRCLTQDIVQRPTSLEVRVHAGFNPLARSPLEDITPINNVNGLHGCLEHADA